MQGTGEAARVLVVEDSETIRAFVAAVLSRAGHEVSEAGDGEGAVTLFMAQRPDLVVLDLWLPGIDGFEVLDRLRQVDEAVPVLMLTTVDDEVSKVRGLSGGADDYVVKPVGAAELQARVTALLRRSRRAGGAAADTGYSDGALEIDFTSARVRVRGTEVALTPLEFRLLAAFVRRAGETLSPLQLMELVWNDYSATTTDPVKVYVGYLRRKLAAGEGGAELIETVRGFGYRYAGT